MLTDYHSRPVGSGERHHLVIGLVNNMPDGALDSTERQFRGLLHAASDNLSMSLRYFSLPGLPRGPQGQDYVSQRYENISELWSRPLDGLIVTGTEPRATLLEDEPYWPALRDLVDQVNDHAITTIWSCLAAHAAVFHMDGIRRRPLREKLSGVFECRKTIDHEIVAHAPSRWCVPHSRENELPEEELTSKGYRVVSMSPEVGADMFIQEGKALSIFLQGHLEYDPDALFREYRRDVRRFLAGERGNYPTLILPRHWLHSRNRRSGDEARRRFCNSLKGQETWRGRGATRPCVCIQTGCRTLCSFINGSNYIGLWLNSRSASLLMRAERALAKADCPAAECNHDRDL